MRDDFSNNWPNRPEDRRGRQGRFGRPEAREHHPDHDDPPPPPPPPPPRGRGRGRGPGPDLRPDDHPLGRFNHGEDRHHGRGMHGRGERGWRGFERIIERGERGEGGREGGRHAARRGEARYILLDVLRDGPKHGYEIIKAIEERSSGQYAPSPGTVYPTLQYLADQGHIRVSEDGERRSYELTDSGKAELDARADDIRAFWSRFAAEEIAEASRHEVDFLQEALEDLHRTVWRGLRGAIERGDRETLRGVRQLIEQCRSDVRVLISDNATPKAPNE